MSRLVLHAAEIAEEDEEKIRGNLPVSPSPLPHDDTPGVVSAISTMKTAEAYAEVQRLTRRRARNFAYGIMVLPREKRRAIAAIYAFARRVDDIADGELPVEEKRAQLEALDATLDGATGDDAMFVALADARERFPIPDSSLRALVAGGLQDLDQTRYADFAELRDYCTKVAGAVGVACVAVYGSDDVRRAETLGIGLQLINIIRDVREDWELERVYLPQDELASFSLSEEDIAAGVPTAAWRALMTFQAERARSFLRDGLGLVSTLDTRSALCVSTFAGLYRATLERIEAQGFDVFSGPPHLSTLTKLRIVGGGLRR
jgi:phytoene synthase